MKTDATIPSHSFCKISQKDISNSDKYIYLVFLPSTDTILYVETASADKLS